MLLNKKKIIIAGSVAVVLAVGGGVSFAVIHKPSNPQQLSVLNDSSDAVSSGSSAATKSATSQNVPLNQTPTASSSASGGLNVSTDTAANRLGQITPGQSNKTGGSASASSGSGSSGSSSSNSPFDPTTFAQYDKYKDGTSGLFGDAVKGDGAELTEGKKAAVYYKGWLTNGNLFDQSRPGSDGKLQPFIFTLGEHKVIAGWEQALTGMKVGGVRLVIVPPSVGYGANGQSSIPPNSVLVFQVQLAAVQ